MDRYPVVILDQPIRIFDFKPIPLLCLIAASLVALRLSSYVDPHLHIAHIPANLFTFICAFSLIAGNVKALELKPIKWWLKRLKYIREPLPLFLPESELSSTLVGSGSNCSCLKISNQDLAHLDAVQRLKIADLIVDFANDQVGSLQIYSPPSWAQSDPAQRDFYLISKENSRFVKLSFSMYLRPCNMPALKRQARFRLNCELHTAEKYRQIRTPATHLAHFRAFCESEMAATGIGISATIYADSLNALEYQMLRAQKAVHRMGGTVNTCYTEELEAMISGLPICEDMVAFSHTITSQAAAKFIPFL